jgi:hypothetical protein
MDEHSNIALKIMVGANDCSPNIDIFVREKCVSVYNRIMNSLPARRRRERSARTMQNDVPSCLEAQCHQGERNAISTGDHKFGPRCTHPLKGEAIAMKSWLRWRSAIRVQFTTVSGPAAEVKLPQHGLPCPPAFEEGSDRRISAGRGSTQISIMRLISAQSFRFVTASSGPRDLRGP